MFDGRVQYFETTKQPANSEAQGPSAPGGSMGLTAAAASLLPVGRMRMGGGRCSEFGVGGRRELGVPFF